MGICTCMRKSTDYLKLGWHIHLSGLGDLIKLKVFDHMSNLESTNNDDNHCCTCNATSSTNCETLILFAQ